MRSSLTLFEACRDVQNKLDTSVKGLPVKFPGSDGRGPPAKDIIIVEGHEDCRAVQRAVQAPVLTISAAATRWHMPGNVGIEHAGADAIREALMNCRPYYPASSAITRADLMERDLVADFGQPGHVSRHTALRRRLVCERLGLGDMPGKHLPAQLSAFGFGLTDIDDALSWVSDMMQLDPISTF
ncbi:hypothetical protein WJX73_010404 [Symbiochloris irregularis]|uniref:Ribonuclease M5 C-terminal domain-containing protein n=1 Tax=Symbiochloris irregularis TaxID=706552 RepID=A0AAW1NQM9_9CHLO